MIAMIILARSNLVMHLGQSDLNISHIFRAPAFLNGNAPDFVEVGEAGIAVEDAMRHQRCVQLVG